MFMTTQNYIRNSSFLLLVLLAGCSSRKPTYRLKPLVARASYDQITKKTETGNVTVRCATCSRSDLHEIFGKQGNALLSKQAGKRITPVQIYIENDSNYTWTLSPYDIRLPLTDITTVKNRFNCAATARGLTSFTLASGFGISLAGLGAAASIFHPLIGASIIGAGCSLILMAPIRSHAKTAQMSAQNMHFSHVLDMLSLNDDLVIHPREKISKLIFVEQDGIKDNFVLRLCNEENPDHTISYNLYFDHRIRR